MSITKEAMTESVFDAAAALAEKLGMVKEEDTSTLWEGQPALLVNANGIIIGTVSNDSGEMRTYRYDNYTLNGELLCAYQFKITEQGWEIEPTVTMHMTGGSVLYTGY